MPFRLSLIAIVLTAVPFAAHGQAYTYRTMLELETPVVNDSTIDTVVYEWSTDRGSGVVRELDLVDLSMTALSNGSVVYVDTILVDGAAQPLGGQDRFPTDDYLWFFRLDTRTLEEMRNVIWDTAKQSSGVQYYIGDGISLPTDAKVWIERYIDGVSQQNVSDRLETQTTVLIGFADGFEGGDTSAWDVSVS